MSSPRFFVNVPLPDFNAWTIDDRSSRWLVAVHVPSKSMLWVRAWRTGSVVRRRDCEAQARAFRPDLFGGSEAALVERRPLDAPPGFDTEAAFSVHKVGSALGGVAVAVGAHIRQCLALAYVTRAEGPGAAQVIAERLAFVTLRIFGRVQNRTVDDRAAPIAR